VSERVGINGALLESDATQRELSGWTCARCQVKYGARVWCGGWQIRTKVALHSQSTYHGSPPQVCTKRKRHKLHVRVVCTVNNPFVFQHVRNVAHQLVGCVVVEEHELCIVWQHISVVINHPLHRCSLLGRTRLPHHVWNHGRCRLCRSRHEQCCWHHACCAPGRACVALVIYPPPPNRVTGRTSPLDGRVCTGCCIRIVDVVQVGQALACAAPRCAPIGPWRPR
jgi:hypothetical protein